MAQYRDPYTGEHLMRDDGPINWKGILIAVGASAAVVLIILAVIIAGWVGFATVHRAQARASAHNSALVETRKIATVKAKAEQRYQESVGIKRAQDEINKTLTPLYVQHEAIQALERSGAATVYIPSGNQGVPLVRDTSADHVTDGK